MKKDLLLLSFNLSKIVQIETFRNFSLIFKYLFRRD